MENKTTDPFHYKRLKPEPIEVIEYWNLNFHLGNVLKYISRAGFKEIPGVKGDALEDLKKARWYLDREITRLEKFLNFTWGNQPSSSEDVPCSDE